MGYAIGAGLLTVGLLGLGWLAVVAPGRARRSTGHQLPSASAPAGTRQRRHGWVDSGPAGWPGPDHAGDAGWSCGDGGGD